MSDDGSTVHDVTIHLVHGDALHFRVRLPEWRHMGLGGDIEKAQLRNMIAIELDGKLVMIPLSNIRSTEIKPAPPELPMHIFHGARST